MGKFISKIFPSLTFGNWRWHAVFDEDDRTKHTVNGVAKRDSLPPPSLQGVNISDTPLAPLRCQQTLDKRFDVCRIDVVNGLKLGELFVLFE